MYGSRIDSCYCYESLDSCDAMELLTAVSSVLLGITALVMTWG